MKSSLQIVHVEDSPLDSELMCNQLESEGLNCDVRRVETRAGLISALTEHVDLIISDCTLPSFSGLEALEIVRSTRPHVPFIFLSGTIGEDTAIQSLRQGATDYVLKHRNLRLGTAVRRALEDSEGRRMRSSMEKQLLQSRKLVSLGASMGGVAHDFRNLLQVLQLGIEMLFLDADKPDLVRQVAGRLKMATSRGSRLIDELMAFARQTRTTPVREDSSRLVRETTSVLESCMPAGIKMELHLANPGPTFIVDPIHFDRILTNLVINARDAMPQGGKISVSSDVVQFVNLPPNTWRIKGSPYLRIIVSDTGSGMDEATQKHIFEPFFTTKPPGQGTGLGLSVVFGLMEAHHGFIDLESAPGQGTSFSLFFPLPEDDDTVDRVHLVAPKHLVGPPAEPEPDEAADI